MCLYKRLTILFTYFKAIRIKKQKKKKNKFNKPIIV
jgi:hypothetical protein